MTQQTDCCIVGGGPGGATLALLLARKGISVTLLEAQKNFERDFRGDSLHSVVMELMDELGLSERLLQLKHTKLDSITIKDSKGFNTVTNFKHLNTQYPYITLIPNQQFIEFIIDEAKRYPNFQLVMGAKVQKLIEEDGIIRGVAYYEQDGWQEVRAKLTVGADGRSSRIRSLANFEPIKASTPVDVVWFRLPRRADEPQGVLLRTGEGGIIGMADRSEYWQISYIIPKGSYPKLRSLGIKAMQDSVVKLVPELADRIELLQDWNQFALLSVEASRLERWFRPGLLLIGDAAHVMSPFGGVGISYAIQDAIAAANVLSKPLQAGQVNIQQLAAVQRQRDLPTRLIQKYQALVQNQLLTAANDRKPSQLPRLISRLPILRDLPAKLIAFGLWPARLQN
ncbi:FAD-dependent oxidoreductase [Nostoc sp. C117]|uniref:FAD-dependent oxidoreductase n=1 Tax=Nostoc sp. C117 TaxID=3349875 RepID=UPI00370D0D3D